MSAAESSGHELLEHLMTDLLWKAGIVLVLLAVAVIAAVVIAKRVR